MFFLKSWASILLCTYCVTVQNNFIIFYNIFVPIAKCYILPGWNQVKFSLTNAWINTSDLGICYDEIFILILLEQEIQDVLNSIHILPK